MKLAPLVVVLLIIACSSPKPVAKLRSTNTSLAKDSIVYYETDFETRQKNYLDLVQAQWQLTSMQRQAKLEVESLSNYTITFNKDMTFTISSPCGTLNGNYDVKGTGLKFNNITTNNTNCTNSEQHAELIQLLKQRISAYTVNSKELLLRDPATNIVFKAIR